MKLNTKLLINHAIIGCILLLVTGYYTDVNLRKEKFQSIHKSFIAQLYQVDFAITNFLVGVEYDVQDLVANEIVKTRDDHHFTQFLDADENTFEYNIREKEQAIIDLFNNYRINHPYANSVYMGRENGSFVRSHKRNRPTQYDPRERPWYKLAVSNPDQVMRTAPYRSVTTPDVNIGTVKALVDEHGQVYGVVGIDITLRNLTEYISNISVGANSYIVLLDDSGTILTGHDEEAWFKKYDEDKLDYFQVVMDNTTGYISFEEGNTKNYLFYYTSPALGWKICAVVPMQEIDREVNQFVNRMMWIFALSLFSLSALTAVGVRRFIVKPIKELEQSTKIIFQTGDLDHRITIETGDEIGQLAASFNEMVKSIRRAHDELELRVAERTTELVDTNAILTQEIAERKRVEEELRQAKEAADLARIAAEEAQEAAEAANRAKSAFLANMSHELRTPLNAILGFAQLMTHSRDLPPEHRENLGIISRSGEHLLTLINDVLDMSKIEAGRTTLNERDFDLYSLLDDLEDMFHLRAAGKHLHLVFDRAPDVPQYVRTDEGKLRQVLINLLSNAVKFTQEGSITLRARQVKKSATGEPANLTCKLAFEVEDTGPGIASGELDTLFEAFVQTTTGQQVQEGTGLGLPISRQFVQLMGGEIHVESQVGRGTTLKFDIQCALADSIKSPRSEFRNRVIALEPNQPRYRILIAEDKWDNRQLLIKLLSPLGFEIREASNGQEALEVWGEWEPHLIWMDMRMPVMDGHEATRRIKATTKGQATVVIALTASTFEEDRAMILSEGCDDLVYKPFREGEIFAKLAEHLGVRFVYEGRGVESREAEVRGTAPEPSLLRSLAALPPGLVADLQQATIRSDLDLILTLIDQIREQDAALADALANLAHDFDHDAILTLIERAGGRG